MTLAPAPPPRTTVFLTHVAPDDNDFALWLSSKLAIAGYRVWIDRRRLRGGADAWDEINSVLRNEAIKQIVVFTRNTSKPGVKKELAIGDVMRRELGDPNFIIPIRNDDTAYADAPPGIPPRAHYQWTSKLARMPQGPVRGPGGGRCP